MKEGADSSPQGSQRYNSNAIISFRQATGILLIFLAVIGGRVVRTHMLLGPEGKWREQLWLDELVLSAQPAQATEATPKPCLTDPLPINICSPDSLTLLPGVGPVLADRIDAVRKAGTVFRTPLDLEIVKGIGPALSARLTPLVDFKEPTVVGSLADQDSIPANSR